MGSKVLILQVAGKVPKLGVQYVFAKRLFVVSVHRFLHRVISYHECSKRTMYQLGGEREKNTTEGTAEDRLSRRTRLGVQLSVQRERLRERSTP